MTDRWFRRNWERLMGWLRVPPRHWGSRLYSLAKFIGAATVVLGAAIYIARAYDKEIDWRDEEYAKLQSLKAGFDLAYFKEVLGAPVFSRTRTTGYTESSFKGRGYWVQALSFRNIVKVYAVTACEEDFHPVFTSPYVRFRVELNRTTLANALPEGDQAAFYYRVSGATASSWLYESSYQGNPGYYKDYLWGINDACPNWHDDIDQLPYEVAGFPEKRGLTTRKDPEFQRLRDLATINTYAESAPTVPIVERDIEPPFSRRPAVPKFDYFHGFRIGVDRLLVRTTE